MGLSTVVLRTILVGIGLLPFGCSRTDERVDESIPTTSVEMMQLVEAIRDYQREFHGPPPGDSHAILRALFGENSRGVRFLRARRHDTAGELSDPWGTPYDVAVLPDGTVRVRSAGPNGHLGDADDRQIEESLKRDALR